MRTATRTHTEIADEADLKRTLEEIRGDVSRASSRDELTRLCRHAEGLIALTYSPAWQKKFGDQVESLRQAAEEGFTTTARAINQRATRIGTKPDYDETWGGKQHVYGGIDSEADLRQIFTEIRGDVASARARDELTTLYRRAEYLIALTYAPAWQKKFGSRDEALRRVAEAEFSKVARAINERAAHIGVASDYDETWGGGH